AFLRDHCHWRRKLAAGIVDQAMHVADRLEDRRDGFAHLVFLTDIAGEPDGLATVFLDFRSNGFQFVVLATNQHHPGAECGQFMCSATADAAATAGDNDVLAGKKIRAKYGAVAHQWLTSLAISSETGIG